MAVYFVQSGDGGPIKIGTTLGNPHKRIANLQTGNPQSLRLLVSIPGDVADEKALHAQFAALRERGEWFRPDKTLLGFIAGMLHKFGDEQPQASDDDSIDVEFNSRLASLDALFLRVNEWYAAVGYAIADGTSVDARYFRRCICDAERDNCGRFYHNSPSDIADQVFDTESSVSARDVTIICDNISTCCDFVMNKWDDVSVAIRDRDGGCRFCGATRLLALMFSLPVYHGGKGHDDDLITMCFVCVNRRGAKTNEQAGMMLRPVPAATVTP